MKARSEKELLQRGLEAARRETASPEVWERIEAGLRDRDRAPASDRYTLPRHWATLAKIAAGLVGLVGWLGAARGIDALGETRSATAPETSDALRPTPLDYLTNHARLASDPLELDDTPEVHLLAQILENEEVRR